jgi:hypothetical protein
VTSPPTCPSCGQPRTTRYCGSCGERAVEPDELSFGRFFRALAEEIVPGFEADSDQPFKRIGGRVYRTVYELIRHPGRLTADYIAGKRRPYMKPVQVYVVISLLFFVLGNNYFQYDLGEYDEYVFIFEELPARMVDAAVARGRVADQTTGAVRPMTRAEYTERFNERLTGQKKAMIAVTIPIFALGLVPLFRRRRYGEQLVFSVHYFAALLLFMVVIVRIVFFVLLLFARGLIALIPRVEAPLQSAFSSEFMVVLFIYGPMLWYLRVALKRVYGGGKLVTWGYAFLLTLWHIFLIVIVFRIGLFFTTFYSLEWFG